MEEGENNTRVFDEIQRKENPEGLICPGRDACAEPGGTRVSRHVRGLGTGSVKTEIIRRGTSTTYLQRRGGRRGGGSNQGRSRLETNST